MVTLAIALALAAPVCPPQSLVLDGACANSTPWRPYYQGGVTLADGSTVGFVDGDVVLLDPKSGHTMWLSTPPLRSMSGSIARSVDGELLELQDGRYSPLKSPPPGDFITAYGDGRHGWLVLSTGTWRSKASTGKWKKIETPSASLEVAFLPDGDLCDPAGACWRSKGSKWEVAPAIEMTEGRPVVPIRRVGEAPSDTDLGLGYHFGCAVLAVGDKVACVNSDLTTIMHRNQRTTERPGLDRADKAWWVGETLVALNFEGQLAQLGPKGWTTGPSVPFALSNVLQDGSRNAAPLAEGLLMYSPDATYQWVPGDGHVRLLPKPPLSPMIVASIPKKGMVVLGRPTAGRQQITEFDGVRWSRPATVPFNVYHPASLVLTDGTWLILGGTDDDRPSPAGTFDTVWAYANGAWTQQPALPFRVGTGPARQLPSGEVMVLGYGDDIASWLPGSSDWKWMPSTGVSLFLGDNLVDAYAFDDGSVMQFHEYKAPTRIAQPVDMGLPAWPHTELEDIQRARCLARPGCVIDPDPKAN